MAAGIVVIDSIHPIDCEFDRFTGPRSDPVEFTGRSRAPSEREREKSDVWGLMTQGCRPGLDSCGPSGLSFPLSSNSRMSRFSDEI